MDTAELVETWRRIILGDDKSWVLFAHGTVVVLTEPGDDLEGEATGILRDHGPVRAGTPSADFGIVDLDDAPGWVIYGDHPDVLTYVAPDELDADPEDLAVGLHGRAKRNDDGTELRIVHVEDRRPVE
ncbi:hypothetical protein [Thermomonospora umbrina]|uniref:Uncharacterized protein n=1 Tax=Thermomonospora umbrina TaxID=111806 RepID=A0A3D9SSE5_9ACTN|nr:hypothetical protein [Thermomonospora umbrina]REE98527.1 hypothetical protein DFJ69_4017 [Thermomonospora umbrina]